MLLSFSFTWNVNLRSSKISTNNSHRHSSQCLLDYSLSMNLSFPKLWDSKISREKKVLKYRGYFFIYFLFHSNILCRCFQPSTLILFSLFSTSKEKNTLNSHVTEIRNKQINHRVMLQDTLVGVKTIQSTVGWFFLRETNEFT